MVSRHLFLYSCVLYLESSIVRLLVLYLVSRHLVLLFLGSYPPTIPAVLVEIGLTVVVVPIPRSHV